MGTPSSGCTSIESNIFIGLYDNTTADLKDYLFGESETEIFEGEESDVYKKINGCKKNPGHPHFIPVDKFTIEHLPPDQRDPDLFDFIKVTADLTVKIDVNIVSPRRPEFWPKTKVPYPYYKQKGRNCLRTGTGRVWNVLKQMSFDYKEAGDDADERTCPCCVCQQSDSPSKVWWMFEILTVAHVVFDPIEARSSLCRLSYDSENSSGAVVTGSGIFSTDAEVDICEFVCYTCDRELGKKFAKLTKRFDELWDTVYHKYTSSSDVDNFTFIVSHPHGGPKQISLGRWVDKYKVKREDDFKFTYTASTCPGSSGAPANTIGFNWWTQQFHSGALKSGFNCSTVSSIWK